MINKKQEVINEVKRTIQLGNLDISDDEIIQLIDNLSTQRTIEEVLNECSVNELSKLTSKFRRM